MTQQPPASPAPYPLSKGHIAQYRLYDRDDNLITTAQAALDQWRPGLITRWIVPNDNPPRRISAEARYRGRRRRLRKRLQARAPLFWQDLEKAELEKRAQYYGLPASSSPPYPPSKEDITQYRPTRESPAQT